VQGKHLDAAKRFVAHARSDAAQAIFREAGFVVPP
jgi:ABC-type Fe3+ transport system substrate-binding protein